MTTETTPGALGSNDQLGLVERLRQRTLPKHGGREADSWAHHWNLTPGDSALHAEAASQIEALREALMCAKAAMTQALFYADAIESDGYAEHWTDTRRGASVNWSQIRRAIDAAERA